MDGARFVKRLQMKNILSFGKEGVDIALGPLNVLIGPNGSGKSNLIEVLSLLQASPSDIGVPFRQGGGSGEWLWKGDNTGTLADIAVIVDYPPEESDLRYMLSFSAPEQRYLIENENIQRLFWIDDQQASTTIISGRERRNVKSDRSILAHPAASGQFSEVAYLVEQFTNLRFYRQLSVGHGSAIRQPQQTDLPNDYLLEDGSNFALIINSLEFAGMKQRFVELLQRFYQPVTNFITRVQNGTVQFFLYEEGLKRPIASSRLSDGTLKYLCLLTILLHPSPPPLICIEEPETGLHPDILPTIADLLVEASQRTQLIVTTHSDRLISALGDHPEAIVVCERDENGTRMERLEPERMKEWLEKYSLGMLWSMGEIGGNRW